MDLNPQTPASRHRLIFTILTYPRCPRRPAGYRGAARRYHVRFFGDLCRGWIAPSNMRTFEGRAQFDQLARTEQVGSKRTARENGQFKLSSRNLPKWLDGVAEATASLALDR